MESSVRFAECVRGARSRWNSPWAVLKEGRQVQRLRTHHSAGFRLLLRVALRSVACAVGQDLTRCRVVACRHCLLSIRGMPLVEGRTATLRSWFSAILESL